MTLSIIIVTFKSARFIENCLHSILNDASLPKTEVIVSDNFSQDGTLAIIRTKFPSVKIIENKQNLGFGAANNRGFQHGKGEYVLFLNDDAVVKPGALARLVSFMDANSDAGVVGPRLLYPDGTHQRSIVRFPSIWVDMFRALVPRTIEINTPITRPFFRAYAKLLGFKSFGSFSDHSCERDVDCVLGACLLTRRSILDHVGGFDENIFLWCEENELCLRIRQCGWRIVYYPDAEVIHLGGSTQGRITEPIPKRMIVQKYKSSLYFYEKHTSNLNVAFYKLGMGTIFILRFVFLTMHLCFSTPNKKHSKLAEREASWAIVKIFFDPNYRRQNVYTEMKFKYLE